MKSVLVTTDGQCFHAKDGGVARIHAQKHGYSVVTVTKKEVEESKESKVESQKPERSAEDQAAIDSRLEILKGLGLTEPIFKKLTISGFDDLSTLTEKQAADYLAVLAKEEAAKTPQV